MKIIRVKYNVFDKVRMRHWREANKIPEYVNASYGGTTGAKERIFPTSKHIKGFSYPDVTKNVYNYEEEILQELKDIRQKPFGYIRALWHMARQSGTGEPWDSKFMPQFPGRNKDGKVQYAKYNHIIVSGNDLSNIIYGHICAFMNIPKSIAKLMARLDASGVTEIITKGRFPNSHLRKFKDPLSDQIAIAKGVEEFNIKNYRLI